MNMVSSLKKNIWLRLFRSLWATYNHFVKDLLGVGENIFWFTYVMIRELAL